jgi:hypothetical protein
MKKDRPASMTCLCKIGSLFDSFAKLFQALLRAAAHQAFIASTGRKGLAPKKALTGSAYGLSTSHPQAKGLASLRSA